MTHKNWKEKEWRICFYNPQLSFSMGRWHQLKFSVTCMTKWDIPVEQCFHRQHGNQHNCVGKLHQFQWPVPPLLVQLLLSHTEHLNVKIGVARVSIFLIYKWIRVSKENFEFGTRRVMLLKLFVKCLKMSMWYHGIFAMVYKQISSGYKNDWRMLHLLGRKFSTHAHILIGTRITPKYRLNIGQNHHPRGGTSWETYRKQFTTMRRLYIRE